MTPLPGAVQSTGLILATVLAAAGLNLGVMSLGQAEGEGADVETAATLTSADAGLLPLSDTAPAAVDPGTVTTVLPTDPAATGSAPGNGSTLPAGTGVAPGLPVSSGTSSSPPIASSTAAPAAANTAPASSQQITATTRPASSQATNTLPPATVTTARPTVTIPSTPSTTARPTTTALPATSTTRAPQTSTYDHIVTGAGSLTVSVTDGARLGLVSASEASGWSHTVDTNRADLVKVVFTRRGSEIAVSVTLRNGVPNFTEERSNDD